MSVQEAERTWVARELHDGIGQDIALLGIQMQRAAASIALEPGWTNSAMQKLCTKLSAIGLHVSRLSHQLHSSELEYLGLSVAIIDSAGNSPTSTPSRSLADVPAFPQNWTAKSCSPSPGLFRSRSTIANHSGAHDVHVEVTAASGNLTFLLPSYKRFI
jgi:signal transduction histidine kinase